MKAIKPKAVALAYQPQRDVAPKVVAKGQGELAQKIIQLAREHQLPLVHNPALVDFLIHLPPGDSIPPVIYAVVAEIYAFFTSIGRK